VGLKLNETQQLLVHADDVNLLGDIIDAMRKTQKPSTKSKKEVGLEVITEKAKYMLLARQNHNIKIANRSFQI
jgi:hypothetical protein